MADIIQRIKLRRGTAAAWTSANPVLLAGEEGYETDTRKRKVGDGSSTWTALSYDAAGGGGSTAADITFTPTGTVAATNVQAAIAEVASEGGGGGSTALPMARPKNSGGTTYYSLPGIVFQGQGDNALTAEQVYYEPMAITSPIKLDALACRVNVAATAGGVAHLGVYNADFDWQPTSLVVGSTALATDTTGMKEAGSLNTTLPAGLYLRAIKLSLAATMSYFTGGGFGTMTTDLRNGLYLPRGTGVAGALPATGVKWDAVSSGAGTPFRNHVVMSWSQVV